MKKDNGVFLFRVLPVLILIGVMLWGLDARMRPAIEGVSSHQAQIYAVRCVNEAMAEEMARDDIAYSNIVHISENSGGEVTSIQTDMTAVNKLQTRLTASVLALVESEKNSAIHIPLGSMLGNQLLSGRGPLVSIRLLPVGSIHTSLYNEFLSAGINQTLHRIMLRCEMQVLTIFPGYTITTDTVTDYCVAETVIVGKIPEGYTQISGDDSSVISKINDYQAQIDAH